MAAQTTETMTDCTPDCTPADAVREAALAAFEALPETNAIGAIEALLLAVQGAAEEAEEDAAILATYRQLDRELVEAHERLERQAQTVHEYRVAKVLAERERDGAELVARARMTVMDDQQREIVGLRASHDQAVANVARQVARHNALVAACARAGFLVDWPESCYAPTLRPLHPGDIHWGDEAPAHGG